MFTSPFSGDIGDQAWQVRERARKRRERTIQALLLLILVGIVASVAMTITGNLEERNIHNGFAFLFERAGFDIGEALIPFSSSDQLIRAFFVGVLNTVKVSLISIVGATVLGVIVGMMRLSRHPMLRLLGIAHVEAYRNVPLLVLLLMLYLVVTELLPRGTEALHIGNWVYLSKAGLQFAYPEMGLIAMVISVLTGLVVAFGIRCLLARKTTGLIANCWAIVVFGGLSITSWVACGVIGGWEHPVATRFALRGGAQISPEFLTICLGLTLFTSAAIAEIVRAGIVAVQPAQWNAGLALGLTSGETFSYVIFPQSMRLAIPPLASQYMNLTKNSSLAVMVGYPDLVSIANTAINISAQALEVICIIMSVYLCLNLITAVLMNALNRRIMQAPQ